MNWELTLSIIINAVAIAFFAGNLSANQKFMKETIEGLQKNFDEKFKELKESFNKKVEENQQHTTDSISRLETKQDKHNCLIERTYKLEGNIETMCEQIKVANHRIEDLQRTK